MMYELVYRSNAIEGLTPEDINSIITTSRDFNEEHNITGCLLYHNYEFLEILEGEEEIVMSLYERIKIDPRHKDFMLLNEGYIQERLFKNWSYAFPPLESNLVNKINKDLFISNLHSLSKIIEKPTQAAKLFFYLSSQLLSEE